MLKSLEKFGFDSKYILAVFGVAIIIYGLTLFDFGSNKVFGFVFTTAPIWLPFITFLLFFEFWLEFVQKKFDLEQGRVTLEIRLPQEVFKSPEAMELVLIQMHQSASPDNHVQTYWDGKHPPKYGLELVSRGGEVKFYINCPRKKFKNIVETQLYAQYPGVEIVELDVDYTAEVPWDLKKFGYFAIHFGLKKADAYPIKTYIDYGLQNMPKEEEKIDPITSMIEVLGSVKPGEFYWVQILIDANREKNFKVGSLKEVPDWKKDAKKEIQSILDNAVKERAGDSHAAPTQLLTEDEKDKIKAIERSLSKNAYNTVIRGMYIARSDIFNPGERIGALITGWRSFDDLNRNAIGPRWRTDFDWNWWQDPTGRRKEYHKRRELNEYKNRTYTSWSKDDKSKIMTVEELATVFHIPGKVASTPSLQRLPSKRSEAPSNLPV